MKTGAITFFDFNRRGFRIDVLLQICRVSTEFARLAIAIFIAVSVAALSALPFLTIITDLISGVGERKMVIKLVKKNNEIFVEANVK